MRLHNSNPEVIFHPDFAALRYCFYWCWAVEKSKVILISFSCSLPSLSHVHILKGVCFHPFFWIINWLFNFDTICPELSQISRLFSFPSFVPSFLGTTYPDAVCFLHLFSHLCCFLVDLNLCPGSWLQCLPVSLGLQ